MLHTRLDTLEAFPEKGKDTMRFLIFLLGTILVSVVSTVDASIILIDYDDSGSTPTLGGMWNTFASPSGGRLLDSDGNATGINISFVSGFEDGNTDQGVGWNAGDKDWVDRKATEDFFFTRSVGTVTFSGLAVGSEWRFDSVAARASSAPSRTGDFTVNGSFGDSTPNGDNFNARTDGWDAGNIIRWDSVFADQNGEITLTVRQVSNFAYLNASRLESINNTVPEPASMALFGLGSLGIGVIARRRKRKQIAA